MRRSARMLCAWLWLLPAPAMLVGCGDGAPEPAAAGPAAPRHAATRVGDVTVRANALRTVDLDPAVGERYGIARDPRAVMLLVGVRRGDGFDEVPMPAQVTATVTDLRGQRREVDMRELHGNDPSGSAVLDYFAVVEATPPDTLRFDIQVDWAGGPGATLRVDHELGPD